MLPIRIKAGIRWYESAGFSVLTGTSSRQIYHGCFLNKNKLRRRRKNKLSGFFTKNPHFYNLLYLKNKKERFGRGRGRLSELFTFLKGLDTGVIF
jgi:hypothetical protein